MTVDRIPEDVRKLADGAANDLHPFVKPSDRTVGVIARAIMADRAAREAQPSPDIRCKVCGELPIAGAICKRFDCPALALATPAATESN